MPIQLPLQPGVPFYRLDTVIDDDAYVIDVRWNGRDNDGAGAWYLDFYDEDETPIVIGVKIVLGAYLGRGTLHRLFQEGVFVAIDTENTRLEATLDDLGKRVQVRRYTIEEIIGSDPTSIESDADDV